MNLSASILLPVFNGEKYIARCIDSVLAQTRPDFELLVGDDASADSTAEIVASYEDPRIRLFRWPSNGGLFRNLNRLLAKAEAPLICFLCQDDAMEPECLAAEVSFVQSHPQIGMAFCKTTRLTEDDHVIARCQLNDIPEVIDPKLAIQLFYYLGCLPGNLSTVCVRKTVLDAAGYFDADFAVAADYELWCRICDLYPLGVIHKRLIRLRQHNEQLSRRSRSSIESIRANRTIRAALLGKLPKRLQGAAQRYTTFRQDVLDIHCVITSLLRGRLRDAYEALTAIGPRTAISGALAWLLTMNNRLYKPRPCLDQYTAGLNVPFVTPDG